MKIAVMKLIFAVDWNPFKGPPESFGLIFNTYGFKSGLMLLHPICSPLS